MLLNHLKFTFRNLMRQKFYAFISILGLAVGMTCCVIILFWVQDELAFDQFHEKSHLIHRVVQEVNTPQEQFELTYLPAPLAPVLESNFPDIVRATRFSFGHGRKVLKRGNILFYERRFAYADPAFLDIFTFPLTSGDPSSALSAPYSVILTRSMAKKYFGEDDPIGQTIAYNQKINLQVTGVMEDVPANSHVRFDFLAPYDLLKELGLDYAAWDIGDYQTYVEVRPGTDVNALGNQISNLLNRNSSEAPSRLFLQPLNRIHLHSDFKYDLAVRGSMKQVLLYSLVAMGVLLVACINFMNLSTARSGNRAGEIGIRKVVGGTQPELILQFFSESVLLAVMAMIVALVMVELCLPFFNNLVEKQLTLTHSAHLPILLILLVIVLVTGLLAGSYPAFFLSRFQPVKTLRGVFENRSGLTFRRALVVIQFTFSLLILISTGTIHRQIQYIQKMDMGYDRHHLLTMPLPVQVSSRFAAIKHELLNDHRVLQVSASRHLPISMGQSTTQVEWEGKTADQAIRLHFMDVEADYVKTMGMTLVSGRDFDSQRESDTRQAYLINEEAARQMGLNPAEGQPLTWTHHQGRQEGVIVGVVKNFHFKPAYQPMEPILLHAVTQPAGYFMIRVDGPGEEVMRHIQDVFRRLAPEVPLQHRWLDEIIQAQYRGEKKTGDILNGFALMAIIISAMGLLGLAAFTSENRTREIGIRKVLGASSRRIMLDMSREFIQWVFIANVVAWPLAWILMSRWLQNYAYRVRISLGTFFASAALVLILSFLVVIYQTGKAARANPTDSLRHE